MSGTDELRNETKSRDELGEFEVAEYDGMEYECEYCGKTRTFDGLSVAIRSPFGDDDDECTIHRMHLKNSEAYWEGEIQPDRVKSYA